MKAIALVIALLLGSTFAPAALAHASLDHAAPAVGSTVHSAPADVRLRFTQELEPAFSTVRVLDGNGKQVDRKDPHVDRSDSTLLTVSLPRLAPGTYRVVWRVVSGDTHVTEGDFTFEVAP